MLNEALRQRETMDDDKAELVVAIIEDALHRLRMHLAPAEAARALTVAGAWGLMALEGYDAVRGTVADTVGNYVATFPNDPPGIGSSTVFERMRAAKAH